MKTPLLAALLLAAPLQAETIHPERAFVLNCHFTQSCISGGCGEEDYNVTLETRGAEATFRDHRAKIALAGGVDPVSGQMSFASQPSDGSSYFFSDFGASGAVLSIHTQSEGQALVIAFEGRCEEVQ
ncbi:hypothetical protein ACTTAL_09830 [Rhodobacter capsulatus]|uniref:hypothetical protein n=1 Tax=Rhodobacter capsulatus TaxID=1061 RepID=UPI0003D39D1C|nr:hypothetical protein [Rhodobacter capsulatus]ETD91999.1 hypothetical protein U713_01530 [Rhodobacter capsulatus YW2]